MEYLKNWAAFYKKQLLFALIIFFTASISFAFGYLANREWSHAPIIIEKCATGQ